MSDGAVERPFGKTSMKDDIVRRCDEVVHEDEGVIDDEHHQVLKAY